MIYSGIKLYILFKDTLDIVIIINITLMDTYKF